MALYCYGPILLWPYIVMTQEKFKEKYLGPNTVMAQYSYDPI